MIEEICQPNPPAYRDIAEATEKSGFTMPFLLKKGNTDY